MATIWAAAPAGYEGETGSHIAAQAASRSFTQYRTADGYRWQSNVDGGNVIYLPDGSRCYVQHDAARLPADVAARVRGVLATARRLKADYPAAPSTGPDADTLLTAHDALMASMDRPDSDL